MLFTGGRRGGRLPSFLMIAMTIIIFFIAFNYWDVSNKRGRLLDDLAEVQAQVKRTDAARSRLEKRNSELMVLVETHRKEMDKKESDYNAARDNVQVLEAQVKKCTDEKVKMQSDSLAQASEIQRLKEQLKELGDEFMKQEDQLREMKKNSTFLEKKLESERLQCRQQISQLKEEHAERQKNLEEEATRLKKVSIPENQEIPAAGKTAGEDAKLAINQGDLLDLKQPGKLGSDVGIQSKEANGLERTKDAQFTLKKPLITQKQQQNIGLNEVPGKDEVNALGGKGKSFPGAGIDAHQGHPQAMDDKVVPLPQDGKVAEHVGALGQQHGQIQAPGRMKPADVELKKEGVKIGPSPVQGLAVPMEKEPVHNQNKDGKLKEQHDVELKRHQFVDML